MFTRPRSTRLISVYAITFGQSVHDEYLEMLWILSLPYFNIDQKKNHASMFVLLL